MNQALSVMSGTGPERYITGKRATHPLTRQDAMVHRILFDQDKGNAYVIFSDAPTLLMFGAIHLVLPTTPVEENNPVPAVEDAIVTESAGDLAVRRGPGRPKGSKNVNKQ